MNILNSMRQAVREPTLQRLSFRHHLIIEQNTPLLEGKTIIEIASHDGRWAFAALKAGAKSVYGIEPRKRLVDNANATFSYYGIAPSAYKFVCEDGYREVERLESAGEKFDTAMVLGFLYHTARQYEIIYRLSNLAVLRSSWTRPYCERYRAARSFAWKIRRVKHSLFSPGKTGRFRRHAEFVAVHYMLEGCWLSAAAYHSNSPIPADQCRDYRSGSRFTIVGVR